MYTDKNTYQETSSSTRKGVWQSVLSVIRWCYHSVITLVTLTILTAFLLAAFSDHIAPKTFLYASYMGIGFPILLFITGLWGIFLCIVKSWRLLCIMLLSIYIAHEPISRFLPFHLSPNEPSITQTIDSQSVKTLKIMSYNTQRLGLSKLSDRSLKVSILNDIKDCGADIICLQEYGFSLSKNGYTETYIRKLLSNSYPYYHFLPYHKSRASGIAIFSKYPIKQRQRIDESKHYFASMLYELNIDGRKIALINNHLQSFSFKEKDQELYESIVDGWENDSIVEQIHVNIVRKLGRGYIARQKQSELIAQIKKEIGEETPLIICGDFNDTPVSYCYQTIRGDMSDSWKEAGFGPGITYNKHKLWFRIDHLFHSNHFKTLDIEVLDHYKYSDHYPVMATYQLLPSTSTTQDNSK